MDDDKKIILSGRAEPIVTPKNRPYLPRDDQQEKQATQSLIKQQLEAIYNGQNSSIDPKFDNTKRPNLGINQIVANSNSNANMASQPKSEIPPRRQSETRPVRASVYNRDYYVKNVNELNQNVDWEKYHSAWQNYYQKYYEYYFKQQISRQSQNSKLNYDKLKEEHDKDISSLQKQLERSNRSTINPQDEALSDLRDKLRAKMAIQVKKARKSHHFWPIVTTFSVVFVFMFLQYNRLIFAQVKAYTSPGNVDPETIIIGPEIENIAVTEESKLIIPKINVDVPVAYDISNDHNSTLKAMENGAAHFAIPGANSHPGEIGNTVITAHSSNDVFQGGDYKFIFTLLPKLEINDTIYANYKGTRYTYVVTKKEEVMPNEVNKLVYSTNKPILTLITCVPIGTADRRLLVTAEQVSPDPSQAVAKPTQTEETADVALPGETKSFFESLFGL